MFDTEIFSSYGFRRDSRWLVKAQTSTCVHPVRGTYSMSPCYESRYNPCMRILLTNDDGITAPGMLALYRAAKSLGDVYVVAPSGVCSAKSHSITLFEHIQVTTHTNKDFTGHAVSGMPADCVKIGCNGLIDGPIDLVISGINAGANIGINVLYSGTVGAAREAVIQGIPAIAMSLHIGDRERTHWDIATEHAATVLKQVIEHGVQPGHLLNINLPIFDDAKTVAGTRVCKLSDSAMADRYAQTPGDNGATQYCVDYGMQFREHHENSDVHLLFDRHITITPLLVYQTHNKHLQHWASRF
ncbi:MAG TPA: 5'/3'-nucleotidase SurE [Phycisphaerales bacterium]|nr:5'/3'-nucleotidase SurE [Phycisphaerales bacterium]HCD33142.1 5'/3'-nucleotidase SurE [Phycisphaerales bacterium]